MPVAFPDASLSSILTCLLINFRQDFRHSILSILFLVSRYWTMAGSSCCFLAMGDHLPMLVIFMSPIHNSFGGTNSAS